MPGSFASRRSSCEGREGERLQVCDFQLRIRDDFQEDAAGILIDGFLHRLDIRQGPDAVLEIGHRGVFHARVVGGFRLFFHFLTFALKTTASYE